MFRSVILLGTELCPGSYTMFEAILIGAMFYRGHWGRRNTSDAGIVFPGEGVGLHTLTCLKVETQQGPENHT